MAQVTRDRISRLFRRVAALLCFLVTLGAADNQLEYQVKAAFLLNFTKFIEWPSTAFERAGSQFGICILGEDPFGPALDQIVAGEFVNGRKVVIHRIRHAPEAGTCHVLFVDRAEREVPRILSAVGPGVLTVGEGDGFIREGGMITFVIDNRRVRFDIYQSAAENAHLKLSSKLLSAARLVTNKAVIR